MLSKDEVKKIREDFPILNTKVHDKHLIYLDNAATTQKPQVVIDTLKKFYEDENSNIHRGIYKLSEEATQKYEEAHEIIAKFINADNEEVIFTRNTTESLNLLSYALQSRVKKGQDIVLTEMEHHSNLVPWQQLAKRAGLTIKYIPVKDDFTLDYAEAEKLITENTAIVSFTHVSNALGTVNDVNKICSLAKKHNALSIVDGAQSAPHKKIDVKDIGCDFFAFSGHKMLGPTGIGVLFGRKSILEEIDPFMFGGDMIATVSYDDATWNKLPWKFEAGTPNIAGGIALASAITYLEKIGMDNIEKYEKELLKYALTNLKVVDSLKLYSPSINNSAGIISFNLANVHAHDVASLMDDDAICIRGGHHCAMPLMAKLGITGTSRASFYFYNTKKDVDKFINALIKAEKMFV